MQKLTNQFRKALEEARELSRLEKEQITRDNQAVIETQVARYIHITLSYLCYFLFVGLCGS